VLTYRSRVLHDESSNPRPGLIQNCCAKPFISFPLSYSKPASKSATTSRMRAHGGAAILLCCSALLSGCSHPEPHLEGLRRYELEDFAGASAMFQVCRQACVRRFCRSADF
jgi:hypothetical protein